MDYSHLWCTKACLFHDVKKKILNHNFEILIIYYFCSWLSQPSGMGGSRHIGFRASLTADYVSATSLAGKGRFRTLSSTDSTSQLEPNRRYRNEASMPGVLYLYAKSVSPRDVANTFAAYLLYNTQLAWAGWVAYLVRKAMRRPSRWDKQGSFSHVFFMSLHGQNP